jgi:hypothetical protein
MQLVVGKWILKQADGVCYLIRFACRNKKFLALPASSFNTVNKFL